MQKGDNHYVPKFYLREFLDMRVESPREPSIWMYDKKSGCLRQKGFNNIGYIHGLYNLKLTNGKITTIIEDFFGKKVENFASRIYRKIINHVQISSEERLLFSKFLYFMHVRVPNYLNYMSWFHKNYEQIANMPDILIGIEETIELLKAVNIENDITTLELMIEMSKIFTPIINEMHWQFLIAPVGKYFVTSDNPLILNDPTIREILPPFLGWNNPNIQLTFPLSPNLCLKATWRKNRKTYIKANLQFLRAVNFRTSFYATQYVFSSRPIETPQLDSFFVWNTSDVFVPER